MLAAWALVFRPRRGECQNRAPVAYPRITGASRRRGFRSDRSLVFEQRVRPVVTRRGHAPEGRERRPSDVTIVVTDHDGTANKNRSGT